MSASFFPILAKKTLAPKIYKLTCFQGMTNTWDIVSFLCFVSFSLYSFSFGLRGVFFARVHLDSLFSLFLLVVVFVFVVGCCVVFVFMKKEIHVFSLRSPEHMSSFRWQV